MLALELRERGFDIEEQGLLIRVRGTSVSVLRRQLEHMREGTSEPLSLAQQVENKQREKHHPYLRDDLLAADYASLNLDVEGAREAIAH